MMKDLIQLKYELSSQLTVSLSLRVPAMYLNMKYGLEDDFAQEIAMLHFAWLKIF